MNKFKKGICILIISFLTTALTCDKNYNVVGIIKSQRTDKPIVNAKVKYQEDSNVLLTDEKGFFQIKDYYHHLLRLKIEKHNYKSFDIEVEEVSEAMQYSIRTKSEYVEFSKPYQPNPKNSKIKIFGLDLNISSKSFAIRNDTFIFYLDTMDYFSEAKNKLIELRDFSLNRLE